MKKAFAITIVVILLTITTIVLYSNYTDERLNEYLRYIPSSIETLTGVEVKNLELERVVKKSPEEIVILVKWDKSSAFVSIKDWLLPKAHDEIEIRVFESKKSMKFYE